MRLAPADEDDPSVDEASLFDVAYRLAAVEEPLLVGGGTACACACGSGLATLLLLMKSTKGCRTFGSLCFRSQNQLRLIGSIFPRSDNGLTSYRRMLQGRAMLDVDRDWELARGNGGTDVTAASKVSTPRLLGPASFQNDQDMAQ